MAYGGRSFKAQFREANRSQAPYTIIMGEDEALTDRMQIKDMASGEQVDIETGMLVHFLTDKGLLD
jgi:histidyl-tRNA synthetase